MTTLHNGRIITITNDLKQRMGHQKSFIKIQVLSSSSPRLELHGKKSRKLKYLPCLSSYKYIYSLPCILCFIPCRRFLPLSLAKASLRFTNYSTNCNSSLRRGAKSSFHVFHNLSNSCTYSSCTLSISSCSGLDDCITLIGFPTTIFNGRL